MISCLGCCSKLLIVGYISNSDISDLLSVLWQCYVHVWYHSLWKHTLSHMNTHIRAQSWGDLISHHQANISPHAKVMWLGHCIYIHPSPVMHTTCPSLFLPAVPSFLVPWAIALFLITVKTVKHNFLKRTRLLGRGEGQVGRNSSRPACQPLSVPWHPW